MEKEAKDAHTWPDAVPGRPTALAERRASFGRKLSAAREGRGLTAPALAQVTRIGLHFIAALESGTFEKLPGEVFGRGYVRCICKNLSVDAVDLVAEYDGLWEKVTPRSVLKVEIKSRPTKERNEALVTLAANAGSLMRSGVLLKLGLPAVAGACLVYALVATPLLSTLTRHARGVAASTAPPKTLSLEAVRAPEAVARDPAKAATAAPGPDATTAKDAKDAPAVPSPAVALAAGPVPAAAAAPGGAPAAASGKEQVLELVVTEPVRIKIDVDQGHSVVKELTPDSYRFTFQQKAEMMVYDAAAVKISFNGRSLGSLGGKGRIRRLSFQADGPSDKKL